MNMKKTLNTEYIEEGRTEVLVFKQQTTKKGPGSKQGEPFYNPAMELNRDLSILFCQWFAESLWFQKNSFQ